MRATEPVLGMKGTRDKETEIPLPKLEILLAKGRAELVEFLQNETGRSEKAITRALEVGTLNEEYQLLIACGHDAGLLQRVRPLAGLIREDSFERPMVVLPGSVYVTAGTTRRSTGTHYTPPSLTEPIVQHTLEPLVYGGPAEGLLQEQWQLKSPKEILNLKVCDMTMGSGAFLVQACRYLSERLAESWENEEKQHPKEFLVTPEGGFSQGSPSERLIPQDAAERLAIARRIVADRCLYGVDINPMAVEMAKLSMWLITLDAKRPFTFLDHAFKCGDSLLGLSSFKQLEDFSLRPKGAKQVAFSTMNLWRHVEEAKRKRELLEAMPSDTPEQVAAKTALYAEAEESVVKLRAAADVLVGTELKGLKGKNYEEALESAADYMMLHWTRSTEQLCQYAAEQLSSRRTFHWPLAFPEIIEGGGFHAFIGNPPFMAGRAISGEIGRGYLSLLRFLVGSAVGQTDLAAYFFRNSFSLLRNDGSLGLVGTNTISQGDTAETALGFILGGGGKIYRASDSVKWPGNAAVIVSYVHCFKGNWAGQYILNGEPALGIDSRLQSLSGQWARFRLDQNKSASYKGFDLGGLGFTLTLKEGEDFLRRFPKP